MIEFPDNYPDEYITGKVTFFGREFIVTPDVLIPRLETEGLVRRARQILSVPVMSTIGDILPGKVEQDFSTTLEMTKPNNSRLSGKGRNLCHPPHGGSLSFQKEILASQEGQKKIVVDIGCGSGIIGTSVADLADEVIFLDISPAALEIAEDNFRTHFPDKKAQFIVSDLLSGLPISYLLSPISSALFLTNLPYIRDEDWQNMSADTIHEPKLALFGGEKTGFELYERLFQQLSGLFTNPLSHYPTIPLLYEFGFDQRRVAEEVVKKYPQWEYSFFADYAGIERFGEIIISSH